MNKINEKLNKLFENKIFNIIFLILGIMIILLYLGLYFEKQPIVNEEVLPDVTNSLIPWEVKDGESFIKALATRPFNLNITEYGQYRPRYLAFIVQFLDENMFLHLVRTIPAWGNRLVFYILAMFLTIASIYYFFRKTWDKLPKGIAFFAASTIVMSQNYQVTTYWRARSAKLLAVSACIYLLTIAIKHLDDKFNKKEFLKLLYVLPIFLLMTLDEQVLALVAMITGISVLYSIINKKLNTPSVIYFLSCILYGSFHLWWGKALFIKYTGSYTPHGHTIEGSVSGIGIETFKQSFEILFSSVPTTIFMSIIVFFIVYIYSFIRIFTNSEKKTKEKILDALMSLFICGAAVILLMLMIDAHSAIYNLPCLWKSVYPLVSTIIIFIGLFYVLGKSNYKYNSVKYLIILLGVFASLGYNLKNIDNYYGAYLIEKGGFRNDYTDLIVTKDEIRTSVALSSEMDYDNDLLEATINTPLSTSDYKTTKVLSGLYKGKYLNNELECFLKVKENRNLNINLYSEKYKNIDYILVSINNKEIEKIAFDSKDINKDIRITTEVYRASKVKLKVVTKDKYKLHKKDIEIKALNMN